MIYEVSYSDATYDLCLTFSASVILSFADRSNCDGVRRMLYNSQGHFQEKFALVDLPSALYAGFFWTLNNLQNQCKSDWQMPFMSTIAPSVGGTDPEVLLPKYAAAEGFEFQLDGLREGNNPMGRSSLRLRPRDLISNDDSKNSFVKTLCQETTLDYGQAESLCENLCRDLAFTAGPPGTGKS
jgi:hypothetical protein